MKKLALACVGLVVLLASSAWAQDVRREIEFPDLPGYYTLKCDLHTHTVFSDGSVWPVTRVNEAWRQGLDVTSITDHIEYQPHRDDLPTNHGRSHVLAQGRAVERALLMPLGAEITRDTPPGHFNAIFLKDVKPLDTEDFAEAIKRANDQGAFVFWNHQGWKGEEKGRWLDVHTKLLENKWFRGMEVCNGDEYYPTAHRWCMEKNLTMLGNSDIHDPDMLASSTAKKHRTMTLVFAKERTLDGVKEALLEGRTAVWYKNQLIGRQQWLESLLESSVQIDRPHLRTKDAVWVMVRNRADVDIQLKRTGEVGPAELTLPARATTLVRLSTPRPNEAIEISCTVANWLIAPGTGLPVTTTIAGP